MPVLPFVAAAGMLYSGVSTMQSSNAEAKLQKAQGAEAEAEAQTNATNEAYNQKQAVGQQQLAYLANGVTLEGSPSEVVKASTAYGQSVVNAILKQGAARETLAYQEAAQTQAKGRSALIASVASAVGTGYKSGLFDSPANKLSYSGGGSFSNTAPYTAPKF